MAKTVTVIIQNSPYKKDNKAWHGLRFAGAAMAEGMNVHVHLLDEGVNVGRIGQTPPDGATNLEEMLKELMSCGLEVKACGMALKDCALDESAMIPNISRGSMKSLAEWVNNSDLVLTF